MFFSNNANSSTDSIDELRRKARYAVTIQLLQAEDINYLINLLGTEASLQKLRHAPEGLQDDPMEQAKLQSIIQFQADKEALNALREKAHYLVTMQFMEENDQPLLKSLFDNKDALLQAFKSNNAALKSDSMEKTKLTSIVEQLQQIKSERKISSSNKPSPAV